MSTHSVHYTTGSGTPVILLHSSMSSKEQWSRLQATLGTAFSTTAIDLLGYGACAFPENPDNFTLLDEVERIHEIVQHLPGCDRFHLIGHSYGAAVALRYAYEYQPHVLSLSLYEPVAFHLLRKQEPDLLTIIRLAGSIDQELMSDKHSAATRRFVDFWSGTGTYDRLSQERQTALDQYIRKVSLDFKAGINEPLTLQDYSGLQVPTCLIAGRKSPSPTLKIAEGIARYLPQLEKHWVDGGHMAPITHSNVVNRILVDYLKRQKHWVDTTCSSAPARFQIT